jgi:hypothetical protein
MPELFSKEWMNEFMNLWNNDSMIPKTLESINFTQNIGYGFQGDKTPKTVFIVVKGKATEVRDYKDEKLDWDIRCEKKDWEYYLKNGLTITSLGTAYLGGYMKFLVGDYFSMIKNPSMISPFIKSFELMGTVFKKYSK